MPSRLDLLLVARGLAPNRERAQSEIRSGNVLVNERVGDKPGECVDETAAIRLREAPLRYVSRGGLKLEAALDHFLVAPAGRICVDLGASTGGFTDCLLQRGAARVFAIDVGYGQLAWSLRSDARVVVLERTNARHLGELPEATSLIVGDLSFISLRVMLPTVRRLCAPGGEAVLLVKPQFEVRRDRIGKGGLVREESVRQEALLGVQKSAEDEGFVVNGAMESPVPGAKAGNREWFVHLAAPAK